MDNVTYYSCGIYDEQKCNACNYLMSFKNTKFDIINIQYATY